MKRREKRREEIVAEYLTGDASYRELEARYGVSVSTLHRWVKAAGQHEVASGNVGPKASELEKGSQDDEGLAKNLAAEVRRLRGELYRSELHVKLLNEMIDIAEKELEVPIRKKRGAKR